MRLSRYYTPPTADTHYSIHCSSTWWLQLIHIAPLWNLLNCLLNLSAELSGRHSVLQRLDSRGVFACSWLTLLTSNWSQLYIGSLLVPMDMFLSPFFIMLSLLTSLAVWTTLCKDAGSTALRSAGHPFTCWDSGSNLEERTEKEEAGAQQHNHVQYLLFLLLFQGYSTLQRPLCVISV